MTTSEMIRVMMAGTAFLLILGVAATGLRWFWKRIDRNAAIPAGAIDELRARMAELEGDRTHLAELEERLDFTERLLAQHREPAQIERP